MFIKFKKQSYKENAMEIYLYGILKTLENREGFTMVSIKQLLQFTDLGRSAALKIEQALTSLVEQEVIIIYDAVDLLNNVEISNLKSPDIMYIKATETVAEGEPFIQIYTKEILKFMSTKMKGTKADIFKQFLYLMGFVNQKEEYRKISYPTIEKIARDTGISDRSVKNYTIELKVYGLLYSNILIIGKEKIKNLYSRPNHAQDVDDAIAEAIAKGTKVINNKKGFKQEKLSSENPVETEFKATLKNPELMLKVDNQILDTFTKYGGEVNDQSLKKLSQFQEQHGIEVLIKGLHITMDGKKGLGNPTGFILKQLGIGQVLKDAEYQINRMKENSERLHRDDNEQHYDYIALWRERKEREREEAKQKNKGDCNLNDVFSELLFQIEQKEESQPKEEWLEALGF